MKKKVLIIGPYFYGYNESIARGFQKNGLETKIINTNITYPSGFKGHFLVDILPNHFKIDKYIDTCHDKLNNLIKKRYDEYNPDLVFCIKGNKVYGDTLKYMQKSIKVLWVMDSIYTKKLGSKKDLIDSVYGRLSCYNYRFFFEKTDVERLAIDEKSMPHNYFLPLALDEEVYFPMDGNKHIDISFVGKLSKDRVHVIDLILANFPDKKIEIYGNYKTGLKVLDRKYNYYFRGMRKYYKNISLGPIVVNRLYSQSKICLNLHKPQSVYGCNQRFFEILGAKAFQLVNSNRYIEESFEEGKMFVSFDSDKELLEKIEYFLKHDAEREQIAKNGYRKVTADSKFSDRIGFVLSKIGF